MKTWNVLLVGEGFTIQGVVCNCEISGYVKADGVEAATAKALTIAQHAHPELLQATGPFPRPVVNVDEVEEVGAEFPYAVEINRIELHWVAARQRGAPTEPIVVGQNSAKSRLADVNNLAPIRTRMSYSIQAILAAQGTFDAKLPNGMEVLQLNGGVEMIALGSTVRNLLDIPLLPLTDEGVEELPAVLHDLCSALSVRGPVAYVEAEIFGGSGTQAHTLISAGGRNALVSVSNDAINSALEWLGVWPAEGKDRFDTVGLGRYRETDSWMASTNP